jgi:PiT family inorganic phosphate transporter
MAGLGVSGVKWTGDGTKLDGVVGKILLPALISPLIAILVATVGTWLVFRITSGVTERYRQSGFRVGQVGSASLVSLAHGTNDAQKTMGVMTLALIAAGVWTDTESVPFWVKVTAASAIALGTWLGGWRIIRTLGKGLIDISPAQGMAAESSSAAVILSSSGLGFALSTTHVATGSILGSGVGRGAPVRWNIAGRMVAAWAVTLPSAGLVGAVMWFVADTIGGALGALVIFLVLVAFSAWMWFRARRAPIGAHNVNDEWHGTPGSSRVSASTPTSPTSTTSTTSPTSTTNGTSPNSSRPKGPISPSSPTSPTASTENDPVLKETR